MKVLIGIGETQESDFILAAVKRFPWAAGTEMRILCVAEKVHPSMLELMGRSVQDVQWKQDLHVSAVGEAAAVDLRDSGLTADTETIEGDPKAGISAYAKDWSADLIVVGSDAGGRLRKALLGSVATAVVKSAPCSVLVIRITDDTPE
jgi:nucleotide-binding universal stress UspA family protein